MGTVDVEAGGIVGSYGPNAGGSGAVTVVAGNVTVNGELATHATPGSIQSTLGSISGTDGAGAVTVDATGSVTVSNGGILASDAEDSQSVIHGEGTTSADVSVTAKGAIIVEGTTANSSPSFLGSLAGSSGAGSVTIQTPGIVAVSGGGELGSDSFAGAGINSGTVNIMAASLSVDGAGSGGQPVSTVASLAYYLPPVGMQTSGSVMVTVTQDVSVSGGAELVSKGVDSGTVMLSAANVTVSGTNVSNEFSELGSFAVTGSAAALTLTAHGTVTVSGGGELGSDAFLSGGVSSGEVKVTAENVEVTGADVFGDPSLLASRSGSGQAGNVVVQASDGMIEVANGGQLGSFAQGTGLVGQVQVEGAAVTVDGESSPYPTAILVSGPIPANQATALSVTAGTLNVDNGASISAYSFGSNAAGAIAIDVTGTASLSNGGAINSKSFDSDSGGLISITANTLVLDDSSSITATGGGGAALTATVDFDAADEGRLADVSVVSPTGKSVLLSSIVGSPPTTYADFGTSTSGSTTVPLGFLSSLTAADLNGQWELAVQTPEANGGVPAVTLMSWSLSLGGVEIGHSTSAVTSNEFMSALTAAGYDPGLTDGKGGAVSITTASLQVAGGSLISATTQGKGIAGDVTIKASNVFLSGGGRIESESELPPFGTSADVNSLGKAGSVLITTGDFQDQGGTVSVQEAGDSGSGNISISASGNQFFTDGGVASAESGGDGGNITLQCQGAVAVQQSTITADAHGSGGNITIDPALVVLQDSQLSADAGVGMGGNITITAGQLLNYDSTVTVSSVFGTPGTVLIDSSPDTDIAAALTELHTDLASRVVQLEPACGQMVGDNVSSFVPIGNGGMPAEPGGLLPSFDPLDEGGTPNR